MLRVAGDNNAIATRHLASQKNPSWGQSFPPFSLIPSPYISRSFRFTWLLLSLLLRSFNPPGTYPYKPTSRTQRREALFRGSVVVTSSKGRLRHKERHWEVNCSTVQQGNPLNYRRPARTA